MSLYEKFETSRNLEKEGVWIVVDKGVKFLLRRYGGENAEAVTQASAKFHKPVAKLIELGSLPKDKEAAIWAKIFFTVSVAGWEGVKDRAGNVLECNMANAVKVFTDLPELFNALFVEASRFENYKTDFTQVDPEEAKADLGNSSSDTSTGPTDGQKTSSGTRNDSPEVS